MEPLPPDIAAEVEALSAEADGAAAAGAYSQAIARYVAAFSLLPSPASRWSAASALWASLADARFRSRDWAGALQDLALALAHGDGDAPSPRLFLRRGQCLLEMGHRDAALDALARAYVGAGRSLFAREDPKYLAALREVLPPAPGEDDL